MILNEDLLPLDHCRMERGCGLLTAKPHDTKNSCTICILLKKKKILKKTKKDQTEEGQELLECSLYLASNDWQQVVTLLLNAFLLLFKTVVANVQLEQ